MKISWRNQSIFILTYFVLGWPSSSSTSRIQELASSKTLEGNGALEGGKSDPSSGINSINNNAQEQGEIGGSPPGVNYKFGEVPTNRVLPVDQLTEADYEEEDQQQQQKDQTQSKSQKGQQKGESSCSQVLTEDLLKVLSKLKNRSRRVGRQSEDSEVEDDEGTKVTGSGSFLQNYFDFDFDPVKIFNPIMSIVGGAMDRNITAIDNNYKQLPPVIKNEVTVFISLLNELIKVPQ